MEAALRAVLKDALGPYVEKGLEQSDLSSFPLVLRDIQLNAKYLKNQFDTGGEHPIELTCGKIGSVKVTPGWMGNIEVVASNIELSFSFSATKAVSHGMKRAMGGEDDPALAAALAASMEEEQQQQLQQPASEPVAPVEPAASRAYQSSHRPQSSHSPRVVAPRGPADPRNYPVRPGDSPRCPDAPRGPRPPAAFTPQTHPRFCSAHNTSEKRVKGRTVFKECIDCGEKLQCCYKDFQFCPNCSEHKKKCMICGKHAPKSSNNPPESRHAHYPQALMPHIVCPKPIFQKPPPPQHAQFESHITLGLSPKGDMSSQPSFDHQVNPFDGNGGYYGALLEVFFGAHNLPQAPRNDNQWMPSPRDAPRRASPASRFGGA